MPASHSKLKNVDARVVCGCAVLPLNGTRANACRGPAPTAGPDEQDIVDEVRGVCCPQSRVPSRTAGLPPVFSGELTHARVLRSLASSPPHPSHAARSITFCLPSFTTPPSRRSSSSVATSSSPRWMRRSQGRTGH